jgi:protein subunit release factor A
MDSRLFSQDLSKAYMKHAAKHGVSANIIKDTSKAIEIALSGQNVYSFF